MLEQGQASPIATPSIRIRDEGQIGARPSIRTAHRVVSWTIGTEAA